MVHVLKFVLYSPCRCSSLPFTREIIWFISLFRINHHRHPDGNFVWKSKIYSKNKLGINKRYTVSADRRVICVAIDLISSVFFFFSFLFIQSYRAFTLIVDFYEYDSVGFYEFFFFCVVVVFSSLFLWPPRALAHKIDWSKQFQSKK